MSDDNSELNREVFWMLIIIFFTAVFVLIGASIKYCCIPYFQKVRTQEQWIRNDRRARQEQVIGEVVPQPGPQDVVYQAEPVGGQAPASEHRNMYGSNVLKSQLGTQQRQSNNADLENNEGAPEDNTRPS